jgi:hypothetical protein
MQEGHEEDTLDSDHRCNDGSDNVASTQSDATMPSSKSPLLTSQRPSPEAVRDRPRNDNVAQVVSPAEEVAAVDRPHIGIEDVTFLRVEGQRETHRGPEYLFVGQTWLQPTTVPTSGLVDAFRRDASRQKSACDPEACQATERRSWPGGIVTKTG